MRREPVHIRPRVGSNNAARRTTASLPSLKQATRPSMDTLPGWLLKHVHDAGASELAVANPELWRHLTKADIGPKSCKGCSARLCWDYPKKKAGCVDVGTTSPQPPAHCDADFCSARPESAFQRPLWEKLIAAVAIACAETLGNLWEFNAADSSNRVRLIVKAKPGGALHIVGPDMGDEIDIRRDSPVKLPSSWRLGADRVGVKLRFSKPLEALTPVECANLAQKLGFDSRGFFVDSHGAWTSSRTMSLLAASPLSPRQPEKREA